jgi:hypothetical protein
MQLKKNLLLIFLNSIVILFYIKDENIVIKIKIRFFSINKLLI